MADPDNLSIATEACLMLNAPQLIAKARDEWIPQIQSDIQLKAKPEFLGSLKEIAYGIISVGQAYYALPTDIAISGSGLALVLLSGTFSGSVVAGSASTVTLDDTGSDLAEENMLGKEILITSASTGGGSISNTIAYNDGTDQATVKPDFNTDPANGDGYLVVDTYTPLKKKEYEEISIESKQGELGPPKNFYPFRNSANGEIFLSPVPDKTYGLQLVYTLDVVSLSYTSALWTKILKRWKSIFVWGVVGRVLLNLGQFESSLNTLNKVDELIVSMVNTE